VAALVCSPALPTLASQVTIYGWSTSVAWQRRKAPVGFNNLTEPAQTPGSEADIYLGNRGGVPTASA